MAWNEPGPGRDPWNQGPKKGEGPPDLDEMLKRLKARFGNGRKPGPGAPGGGGMPVSGGFAGLLIAGIGLLWVASGLYVVDEQERGVVLRFGKHVDTTEPGLRWRLPWPIDRELVINVTGVRAVKDTAVMLTRDENIVDVELSVQYRISKVEDYVFNLDDPDMTLRQVTTSAVREVVGRNTMDFILTEDRRSVGEETKKLLQERLDKYQAGLIVTEVNLQQAQPPEPVQAAFADAIKAREDQQRLINEAEAYANDRLPKAGGAAARQIAEATGYRDQTIARAEGEASRFTQLLTEYRKAPKVTRQRLYLDSMNNVLNNSSKIVLDVDKGNPMLYLPLDQILKNSQNPVLPPDSSGLGPSPPLRSGDIGSDPSRSRDRGR